MDLRAIKYVSAIVQYGSVSRAAEELYISQSALSQYIRKVEADLGVALFIRSGNRLSLTRAGEIFLHEGNAIQQMFVQMCHHVVDAANSEEKIVRMGISQFYSKYYLPRLIPALSEKHPEIHLQITEEISSVLEDLVISGILDFCAVPMNTANENLEYKVIRMEEVFLAIPKDDPINAAAQPGPDIPYMDLSLLKGHPFVMMKAIQKFAKMGDALCEAAGFVPNVICELMSWDAINRLIGCGLGVGFVPGIVMNTLSPSHAPNYYRIVSPSSSARPYAVAYSKTRPLPDAAWIVVEQFKQSFEQPAFFPSAAQEQFRFDRFDRERT